MTTLADRMSKAFDPEKHSQAELARKAKVKQPSVWAWFSGNTQSLKGESLLRAAAYLEVSALWLGLGEGPMRPASNRPAWPFPTLPEETVCALDRDTLIALEGGLYLQSAQMGLNLRNAQTA